ncbi:MAG: hypothetical protein QOH97_1885, partial [Actinoplanes sp.]|nr:hypothetical protein [Actinoplanes sp.]
RYRCNRPIIRATALAAGVRYVIVDASGVPDTVAESFVSACATASQGASS